MLSTVNIRRIAITAAALAVIATPLAAGAASAGLPTHPVHGPGEKHEVKVTGYGATVADAEADADAKVQQTLVLFYDHCTPTEYSNIATTDTGYSANGGALCFTLG
jgi:hypothetical protein